jgi:hypothetical protein
LAGGATVAALHARVPRPPPAIEVVAATLAAILHCGRQAPVKTPPAEPGRCLAPLFYHG